MNDIIIRRLKMNDISITLDSHLGNIMHEATPGYEGGPDGHSAGKTAVDRVILAVDDLLRSAYVHEVRKMWRGQDVS